MGNNCFNFDNKCFLRYQLNNEVGSVLEAIPQGSKTLLRLYSKSGKILSEVEVKGSSGPGGIVTWGDIEGNISDNAELSSALESKQDNLVSGENIKTINNQSILGSGNIKIDGTDDADEIIFKESVTVTNTVGGLEAGTQLQNKTVREIIELMVTGSQPTPSSFSEVYAFSMPEGYSVEDLTPSGTATCGDGKDSVDRLARVYNNYSTVKIDVNDENRMAVIITKRRLDDIKYIVSIWNNWSEDVQEFMAEGRKTNLYVYTSKTAIGRFEYEIIPE